MIDSELVVSDADFDMSALGAGALAELGGADAQADLSAALIRSTVQLTADGMREALYIIEACGPEGVYLVDQVLKMKNHQNPGAGKRLVEAIKSLALYEHLKGFNLNLGGK